MLKLNPTQSILTRRIAYLLTLLGMIAAVSACNPNKPGRQSGGQSGSTMGTGTSTDSTSNQPGQQPESMASPASTSR